MRIAIVGSEDEEGPTKVGMKRERGCVARALSWISLSAALTVPSVHAWSQPGHFAVFRGTGTGLSPKADDI